MLHTDRVSLDVEVNGLKMPEGIIVLQQLAILSHFHQYMPAGQLVLNDPTGAFEHLVSLSDSTPIVITVGPSQQSAVTYKLRVFKPKISTAPAGVQVSLVLYWDNPLYWGGTTNLGIHGSSADVITQLAAKAGITADVDPTNDLQVWIPGNSRLCQFAYNTAKAGWVSTQSMMLLGLTLGNVLRYKNVGEYDYPQTTVPLFKLGELTSDGSFIPGVSWDNGAVGGYNNFRGAYHEAQQNLSFTQPSGTGSLLTTVDKKRMTQYLNMNSDVKATLGAARKMRYSLLDCGNVHANYHAAVYQNERLLRTHSETLEIVTMVQTKLDLFDKLQVMLYRPTTAGDAPKGQQDINGFYFAIGKGVYVGPEAIYLEKLVCVRDGHNTDPAQLNKDV